MLKKRNTRSFRSLLLLQLISAALCGKYELYDEEAVETATCFCSSVAVTFVILTSVSMTRRPPEATHTTRSSSRERHMSTENPKFSMHATGLSQGDVIRGVNGSKVMHGTYVTARSELHQTFTFGHSETARTISSVANGNISEYDKNALKKQTTVSVCKLHLHTKEDETAHDLPLVMLSDNVGCITSPGFNENHDYPNNYNGAFYLNVAHNESVLINFIRLHLQFHACALDRVVIEMMTSKVTGQVCEGKHKLMTYLFRESLCITFYTDSTITQPGFKMMFAILPRYQEPKWFSNKLLNCSVPNFHLFKLVLNCNLLTECEGGEDEQDCDHSISNCGMENTIDTGTKCYSLVLNQQKMTWFDAHKDCIRRGQKLATFENPEHFRQIKKRVPPMQNLQGFFIGIHLKERQQTASVSALYRNIWQWVDGRTVFSVQIYDYYQNRGSCTLYNPWLLQLNSIPCHEKKKESAFVCEFFKHDETLNTIPLADNAYADPIVTHWRVSVIKCPSDQVTRDFLSCDYLTACGASYFMTSCSVGGVTVPMFLCQRSRSTVHYTLVCDHMQHCSDNSDEDFCEYPECSSNSLQCGNGQCIYAYQQCDGKLDCYDGSDEVCPLMKYSIVTTSPPGSVNLDGRGNFWLDQMNDTDECPLTHFLCPRSFCLPVYLRCNGIDDCMGREDEVGCKTYKCRGFYRCRGSKVCLHPEHVCDGVPQCPEQDDELLCKLDCPDECNCQGLAFVCVSKFSVTSYLSLRYLDGSGSYISLYDVRDNIHLIALRLSRCRISNLPANMTLPNMRELDLSWNRMYRLNMQHYRTMKNLKVLILMGNPLVKMTDSGSSRYVQLTLERVDLSHSHLEDFSGGEFANIPNVKVLNISWSRLRWIAEDSFQATPQLESLDLRGCHLRSIPKNLLRDLKFLRIVHAENYRLCCEAMLPIDFELKNCHATRDLLASCEDLLKSNMYRVFLWIFASLSLVGNVFSVGVRLYKQSERGGLSSFVVFVTNLSVVDFFMGVYLAIIGTADFVYRGRYLWRDDEWKNSAVCKIAGFLCVLSSETSALSICLITLDRFLVLRFPFSRLHFGRRSALVASAVVWGVGISLATIPLLPMTSHWEFYRQTGICIPLPFTSNDLFRGYHYSFGVSILLNLVLFLLIAVGQAVIYRAVRTNSLPSSANTQARDVAIAKRLITVVVSDFLCWFPIGLLGLLASTGTPIPGYLNVAMATIVLPVNSALNPFLYTFSLFKEKRRKAQTEKLLKRLELERRGQKLVVSEGKVGKALESVDKRVIIQQIKAWISERVLAAEDLMMC